MKIGIFSKVMLDKSLEDAIRIAGEAGYDGIELSGNYGNFSHLPANVTKERLNNIKGLLSRYELEAYSLATYCRTKLSESYTEEDAFLEFEKYLHIAQVLGAKMIRVNTASKSSKDIDLLTVANTVTWIRRAADMAMEKGKGVVLEMHGGQPVDTPVGTRALIELIDRKNVGVTYDPGNIYDIGEDYGPAGFDMLSPWVWNVHVRDDIRTVENDKVKLSFVLMGEGGMNYLPLMEKIKESGYDGYLTAECHRVPSADLTSEDITRHELKAIRALVTGK